MKINPGFRSINPDIRKSDSGGSQPLQNQAFSDMMKHHQHRSSQEQLKKMLDQIQLQGDRLIRSMTIRELRQYKRMVRQFLEETVRRGVGLKETRGWDRRGRGKRYKLLEEIDHHLLEMADELLQVEEGRVNILHKVGEIRGMLINLLF
ncbi:YaaR family protein [Marinicrinis lubricantis]|uniref:YaaR family protein n=1 Tax=Marinicrinis lubricantis TaxID=2086470 RepID=A0ABW1IQB7_9BACL